MILLQVLYAGGLISFALISVAGFLGAFDGLGLPVERAAQLAALSLAGTGLAAGAGLVMLR